jgi:cytoskeletal protein CcmA (bactofilin family)
MALWKDSSPASAPAAPVPAQDPARDTVRATVAPIHPEPARPAPAARTEPRESVIATDLLIEGKIEGSGHVRIAGRFKGDVKVDGNLTLEKGAQLHGQVQAGVVIVAGELHGNIDSAKRVELQEGGVINGDVKAGSLTVAAGSRMRGQVEFGWDERPAQLKGVGSGS